MSDKPLQEPSFLILTALAAAPKHGYAVIQEVERLSDGRVVLRPGTMYTALDRMADEGLVEVDREEVVDARLRRYYRITGGAVRLAAEADRLRSDATAAVRSLKLGGVGGLGRVNDEQQVTSTDAGSVDAQDETMAPLERRYRRWIGMFPAAYRVEREDELVGVLLDAAAPGQGRPRLADVVDLAQAAAVAHVRTAHLDEPAGVERRERRRRHHPRGRPRCPERSLCAAGVATRDVRRSVRRGAPVVRAARLVRAPCVGDRRGAPGARPDPTACAAAWIATAARVAAVYEVATVPPYPWSVAPDGLSVAQPIVVQLTLSLIAAVLLSRPRRVRATIVSIGRRRLVVAIAAFLVLLAAQRWGAVYESGFDVWLLVLPFAIVLACWVSHVPLRRVVLDPVARRIGAGLLAVLVVFVVSDAALGYSGAGGVATRKDLAATFAVGVGTAVAAALVLAVAPVAARIIPFKVVRRG